MRVMRTSHWIVFTVKLGVVNKPSAISDGQSIVHDLRVFPVSRTVNRVHGVPPKRINREPLVPSIVFIRTCIF